VVEAVTQPSGFWPGLAARMRLGDGRRAFVKAVGPEPNPDSPGIHRSEARTMAALPRSAPAPRMLWSLDRDGWVALAFEDVDGAHPTLPWRPDELARVLAVVADLTAALTPAPPGLPTVAERLQDSFVAGAGWPPPTPPATTTWPGWIRGRPATYDGWPTWSPAGRRPPGVRPSSTPTCGPTTCC
jgi:hypothetical protein